MSGVAGALLGAGLAFLGCSADEGESGAPEPGGSGASGASAGGGAGAAGAAAAGGELPVDFTPTGGGGSSSQDAGCGAVALASEVVEEISPGNVLVVFDRSLSMINWVAASDALIAALEPQKDALTIGALFFPSNGDARPGAPAGDNCDSMVHPMGHPSQIAWLPGQDFTNAWVQAWQGGFLFLGTPLDLAMEHADTALTERAQVSSDPTAVIVVTDGEPTCRPGAGNMLLAEELAGRWLGQGVKTHVLGVPGITVVLNSTVLDAVAVAGGTGRFIGLQDATLLRDEVAKIASTVVTRVPLECSIKLDPPPPNPDEVHLVATETASGSKYEIPLGDDTWMLGDGASSAELVGSFCDDVKAGAFTAIEFQFGCVEVPILPQ